jgi:poly(3-hydroxybutyrate) depolymerase
MIMTPEVATSNREILFRTPLMTSLPHTRTFRYNRGLDTGPKIAVSDREMKRTMVIRYGITLGVAAWGSLALASCTSTEEDWDGTPQTCGGFQSDTCREETVVVDGVTRSYIVTGDLTARRPEPVPLVIVWHGSGTNGEYVRRRFSLPSIGNRSAIIVYPNGLPRPELDGRSGWNRDPLGNDIRFFDDLVDHLADLYAIDRAAVFSVGHSRGGRFVDVLACYRADAHSALAFISAGTGNVSACPGSAPIWITHGRRDGWVGFKNGVDWVRRWAANNGCDPVRPRTFANDECTVLPGCGVEVVWCPHTSDFENGHGPPPFAEEEIERFFARYLS